MGQCDVVGLHRTNEVALPVDDDAAVAEGLEQTAEAARPNEADKEAVLVLV